MARLVVKSGPHKGMSFRLAGERISLGRDFSNHIQVPDSKSSRHHAEIRSEDAGWVVWDLGSSNGTYVNRRQVKRHVLKPGDEIRIGETALEFVPEEPLDRPRLEREPSTDEFERYETLIDKRNPLLTGEFAGAVDVEKVRRANERLVRLYELARAGAGSDTLDELFMEVGVVVESALEADRVFGILLDDRGRWMPLGRSPGAGGAGLPGQGRKIAKALADTPVSMTVVETVRRERKPVLSRAGEDSRFRDQPSVKLNEIGSVLCVPLTARESFLGVLYADRLAGGEDFERADLEFLDAAAAHLGLAVEALKAREAVGRRAEALARVVRSEHAIIGESEPMKRVMEFIERAAPVDAGVLILGGSGTGKELVARAMHYNSRRADGPFEVVNCAALSESLVESELFGHVKGAFTGATADRPGRFELADKGTIFLDEVGELPESIQTKLLRILEQGESVRVGDARVRYVDVRVIAATNRDIDKEVSEGRFREDLYYRLNVLRVELPPLRKRGGDLDLLIDHYLRAFAEKTGRAKFALSGEVRRAFRDYSWPGNVRELKNALERLAVLVPEETVDTDDLPPGLLAAPLSKRQSAPGTAEISLADIEREHILRVLDSVGGNKKRAAEVLGIDRSTLYAKLKAYGM